MKKSAKIKLIELQVKNWGEMIEWYLSNLNLKIIAREDDHKFALLAGDGGAMLALFAVKNLTQSSARFTPYFRANNLKETVSNLKNKSVHVEEIQIQHWGKQARVQDLEENEFYLYEENRNF